MSDPPAPPKGPLAVTIPEAARLLSISPRNVIRRLGAGDLKRIKIGRSTRVLVSSIQSFIERGGNAR